MHDAIMIMHFKKYDKLGVARATTIIFHPVDRSASRSPDSSESNVKSSDFDRFVFSRSDKRIAEEKWSELQMQLFESKRGDFRFVEYICPIKIKREDIYFIYTKSKQR